MTTITPELRQTIEQTGHAELVDPETNDTYIVIRAEHYERIKSLIEPDAVDAMAPLLADVSPEDWEDASEYGL